MSNNFFFSSRRRHTRWNCDWSSDVCSSDLVEDGDAAGIHPVAGVDAGSISIFDSTFSGNVAAPSTTRSEERRVGKECRSGWWPYAENKKREGDKYTKQRRRLQHLHAQEKSY